MKTSGIYVITVNRINGLPKFYIGQTYDLRERWFQHFRALRTERHDNIAMLRSYQKYGENAFSYRVVLICEKDLLTCYEQIILDAYRLWYSEKAILNVMRECVNSHLGVKRTLETIERMSASQRGRKKSPEYVEKMRSRVTSEATRHKLSIALTGKRHSEETRKKLSESLRNAKRPEDWGARISAGKLKSAYAHSDVTKAKIAISLAGRTQSEASNAKRRVTQTGLKRGPEAMKKAWETRRARAKEREYDGVG